MNNEESMSAKDKAFLNAQGQIDVTAMTYNELMELYKAVRDELYRRNNETPKLLID